MVVIVRTAIREVRERHEILLFRRTHGINVVFYQLQYVNFGRDISLL